MEEDPAAHLLYPDAPVPGGLSVAFVGDGFDEAGLPAYGKAVNALVTKLRQRDVLVLHQARFNFYRIDVVDSTGETESLCDPAETSSIEKLTDLPLDGESDPPVDGTKKADLKVQQCWNGYPDHVLFTDLEDEALELAGKVPDLKVVVVVANARLAAGATQSMITPQDTAVLVVGAHASATATDPTLYEVDEIAATILTHELGHALGLLDEYDHQHGDVPPDFQTCRNVWKPAGPPQQSGTPAWPGTVNPIPWQGILVDCCSPATMVPCRAQLQDGDCMLQDVTAVQAYCSFVPPGGDPCDPPPECDAFPGAWEGAFYSDKDYYRARRECRMSDMGIKQRFCEACRQYLDIYLGNFGPNPTGGPWPEERCESPGCLYGQPVGVPPEAPTQVERTDESYP
jgi:hypothetical protein